MTLFQYIGKLQRGIANLADELREQQSTIDQVEELLRLLAPSMAMLEGKKEVLTEKMGELLRAYEKAGGSKYLKEAEKNDQT